jgi:hypothetical protein
MAYFDDGKGPRIVLNRHGYPTVLEEFWADGGKEYNTLFPFHGQASTPVPAMPSQIADLRQSPPMPMQCSHVSHQQCEPCEPSAM